MTNTNTLPRRLLHLASAAACALCIVWLPACDEGNEGDRCNPDLSHDECNSGLVCSGPGTSQALACVENYCCPVPASASTNPYCNGQGCPAPVDDAGATGDDDAALASSPPDAG